MKLVRVTCELETPAIIGPEPIHMDGILWSACREHRCRSGAPPNLPVWAQTLFGVRLSMASAVLPESDVSLQQITTVKRRDDVDIQHMAGRLHRGLGPGKDKMRSGLAADGRLVFLVVAGRARPVRKMLKRVLAVGMDIRRGCGRVREWVVEPAVSTPVSAVLVNNDGTAARNLPSSWCSTAERTMLGALRAPYWDESTQVVMAGTRCALRQEVIHELARFAEIPPRPRRSEEMRRARRHAELSTEA